MTEQKIKQNAEEYAQHINTFADDESVYSAAKDGYILGAHSRDEEIDAMQEQLERNAERIQELLNPWISVKDKLPPALENYISDYVLTRVNGPGRIWYLVNRYDYIVKSWQGCDNNTTHWMPIPQL